MKITIVNEYAAVMKECFSFLGVFAPLREMLLISVNSVPSVAII